MQRVQKLLSNYGYCSRRKAEELIKEGKVKVNGKVITIGDKASEKDEILVDDKPVKKERKVYFMFNKPLGCVTALKDEQYKTVMDYVKVKERVFPVGRLDYNTSGLLLLTNDGDFANRIMHPSHEIKKTYLAEIDRPITDREMRQIENGVDLKDGKTAPAKVLKIREKLIEVTIHEGKNRIVRRIFDALGFKVFSLKRVRIGQLGLGTLKVSRYKSLTGKEIDKVFR